MFFNYRMVFTVDFNLFCELYSVKFEVAFKSETNCVYRLITEKELVIPYISSSPSDGLELHDCYPDNVTRYSSTYIKEAGRFLNLLEFFTLVVKSGQDVVSSASNYFLACLAKGLVSFVQSYVQDQLVTPILLDNDYLYGDLLITTENKAPLNLIIKYTPQMIDPAFKHSDFLNRPGNFDLPLFRYPATEGNDDLLEKEKGIQTDSFNYFINVSNYSLFFSSIFSAGADFKMILSKSQRQKATIQPRGSLFFLFENAIANYQQFYRSPHLFVLRSRYARKGLDISYKIVGTGSLTVEIINLTNKQINLFSEKQISNGDYRVFAFNIPKEIRLRLFYLPFRDSHQDWLANISKDDSWVNGITMHEQYITDTIFGVLTLIKFEDGQDKHYEAGSIKAIKHEALKLWTRGNWFLDNKKN